MSFCGCKGTNKWANGKEKSRFSFIKRILQQTSVAGFLMFNYSFFLGGKLASLWGLVLHQVQAFLGERNYYIIKNNHNPKNFKLLILKTTLFMSVVSLRRCKGTNCVRAHQRIQAFFSLLCALLDVGQNASSALLPPPSTFLPPPTLVVNCS